MKSMPSFCFLVIASIAFGTLSSNNVVSQELFLKNQIGDTGSVPSNETQVTLTSDFKLKTGTNAGILHVTAKVADHWHIYSITQAKGGPKPSKLKIASSDKFKLGKFSVLSPAVARDVPEFDVKVEEHEGTVTWSAPIELTSGVEPKSLTINVTYSGQACESKEGGTCVPLFGIKSEAKFAGYDANLRMPTAGTKASTEVAAEPFAPGNLHAELTARIYRADGKKIQAGDKVKLEIVATPSGKYHIYAFRPGKVDYMATRIALTNTNGWKAEGPKPSTKPHIDKSLGIDVEYHEGPVTWTFDVEIPKSADKSSYSFTGLIGLQTCDEAQCDPPSGAEFKFELPLGSQSSVNATFAQKTYGTARKAQFAAQEKK